MSACAALAEEMTNVCVDPKLRGSSCTCDPLSARGTRDRALLPPLSHFPSTPLFPLLIAHSHHAAPPRGSARIGSTRLGSALVCQTFFALPLGSEPREKKIHTKTKKTSEGASSLTAAPQEVPMRRGLGARLPVLVSIISL